MTSENQVQRLYLITILKFILATENCSRQETHLKVKMENSSNMDLVKDKFPVSDLLVHSPVCNNGKIRWKSHLKQKAIHNFYYTYSESILRGCFHSLT